MHAAFRSEVATYSATPGEWELASVGCGPGEMEVGGGFAPYSTAASSAFFLLGRAMGNAADGWHEGSLVSWSVGLRNLGDDTSAGKLAAICGPVNGFGRAIESFEIGPAESSASGVVTCPDGTVALGGGVQILGQPLPEVVLRTFAPVFPGGPFAVVPLASLGEGTTGAPVGFAVDVLKSDLLPATVQIAAHCGVIEPVVTVVEAGSVEGGEIGVRSASCPFGMVALGGGIDAQNPSGIALVGFAPTYLSLPPAPLTDLDDGPAPAPLGWRATLRNTTTSATREFRVAAICVPEPQVASRAAAILALCTLVRRRGGRTALEGRIEDAGARS